MRVIFRRLLTISLVVVIAYTIFPLAHVNAQSGGMDIDGYCRSKGYVGAMLTQQTVYGWNCKDGNGNPHGMDLYDLCAWQYHGALPTPQFSNFNDPNSWLCTSTNAQQPTAVPPTPVPQQPTNAQQPTAVPPTPVPQQPTNAPPNQPPYAQAQSGNGVSFQTYCSAKYGANEYRQDGDALSWSCMKDGNRIALNFDAVCQDVWGAARPIMVIGDMHAIGSLSCQASGQGGYSTDIGGNNNPPPPSNPPYAAAQLPNGGVHFGKYCAAKYSGTEYRQDGDALSWSCMKDGNRIALNFDTVCQDIWGASRPIMVITDMHSIGSLSCQASGQGGYSTDIGGNNNPPPPPPPNNSACSSLPSQVTVGMIAVVNTITPSALNVRHDPGFSSPIKFQMAAGSTFTIISGPHCADGSTWWEVGQNGNSGWATETTNNGQYNYVPNGYTLPYYAGGSNPPPPPSGGGNPPPTSSCSSAPVPHLSQGMRVQVLHVNGSPLNVRSGPGTGYSTLASVPEGGQLTITGNSPTCGNGYYWWQVQTDSGIQGWSAEGGSDGYYMGPVSNQEPPAPRQITDTFSAYQSFVLYSLPSRDPTTGHISFHLACAVFAVPRDDSSLPTPTVSNAWFEASEGHNFPAGPHTEGNEAATEFNISPPSNSYLIARCIHTSDLVLYVGIYGGDYMLQQAVRMEVSSYWKIQVTYYYR
ncbi:MAG: SH3 domain-containing protein [Aggregatilineales bacterium]